MKKILEEWKKFVNEVEDTRHRTGDGLAPDLMKVLRNMVRQGYRDEIRKLSDLADALQRQGIEADYDPMRGRDPLRVSHNGETFAIQTRDKASAPAAVVGRFAVDRISQR